MEKGGENGRDEGAEKGEKGSHSEASMNRASWVMDKECVYVQACVGESESGWDVRSKLPM